MKKSLISMAALLALMVGCNKEPHAGPGEGLNSEDKVYMEFSIQTLTTRSGTGDDGGSDATPGVEVGLDEENKISSVDVVLRNASTYVCATVTNPVAGAADGNNKTWIATFNSSQLTANTDYEVYIYANCSAKQDEDAVSTATIDAMTAPNKFWMTNAYAPEIASFKEFSTDSKNPTDLGTFYVERSMARFDYMPKGPYTLAEDVDGTDVDESVTVTLTEAALINQSKAFYMLRRVSDNGLPTGANFAIGGVEIPSNYVVDTDYAEKANGYTAAQVSNFDAHLTAPDTWVWKSIVKTDTWVPDNWNGTDDGTTGADGNHELKDYYIWQYCKENTIPGVDIQENGISTGVVFKGKIEGYMVDAANKAPIYVYENVLYGTWDKVLAAAKLDNASESLKFAVSVCNNEDNKAKDAATLATAGFTGYSADADGNYYTYYYYWNRHNDNGDNQKMGKMEFAVVRNNVYKLCVDEISKFGHPTPGGDDPDPDKPDPNDPDEEGEYYFKVSVKVLPWVVRVNHIEF